VVVSVSRSSDGWVVGNKPLRLVFEQEGVVGKRAHESEKEGTGW
jgi:hypothetical protein